MKRPWRKWFGLAAGLILCVEACMLMVEPPSGNEMSLRWRIAGWYDRLFGPRPAPAFFVAIADIEAAEVAIDADVPVQLNPKAVVIRAGGAAKGATDVKGLADWPMFGGTAQRNMANPAARNIPSEWSVEEGKLHNVKWKAELGTKSYGGPVVADGKVFFGTNNGKPRDNAVTKTKAIVMCFNEADGKFLWQAVHEPAGEGGAAIYGMCSTPTVEGKRHYYVTPQSQVICGDNATGKVLWRHDLMEKDKVVAYHLSNCGPLIVDDLVLIVTGNGTDDQGKITSPKAPSFMALHKDTGKPAWQSNLPGENIIDGQWSNPALAIVGGKKQVIFPGGDCWLYSLEPTTGKLLWKCNCNPLRGTPRADPDFNPYFVATPVVHEGRCYIGLGVFPGDHPSPPRYGYLLCLDVAGTGDVSPKSLDAKDQDNKGSALIWAFGGKVNPEPKKGRKAAFGRTVSSCAIHDGLVYISEEIGYMYCLDAKTGERYWQDDVRAEIWGSPFYADGKVFLGTEASEVIVYEAGKKLKQLAKIDMDEAIHSTPIVANGVLYVSTWSKLYAIANKQ